jgi:hypothetical protein
VLQAAKSLNQFHENPDYESGDLAHGKLHYEEQRSIMTV